MGAVVLACAGSLWAADQPVVRVEDRGAEQQGDNPWGGRDKGGATYYIQSIDKVVHLTDAQKQAMTDIITARQKAMQDFSTQNAEKLKAANKAVSDAFISGDQNAIAKAQSDFQALYAPVNQIMKKASEDLNKVLTSEQTAALQDARAMDTIKRATAPAQLTDEQVKQFKAAIRDAAQNNQPGFRENGLSEATIDNLLNFDQKILIAKSRAMQYVKWFYGPANLTAEQMTKVDAICTELAKAHGLNTIELQQDLSAKMNDVLTADQKKALPGLIGAPQTGGANPGPAK